MWEHTREKTRKKRERGNISHVDGCERFDINNDEF
jgi:hypothetical protein